MDASGNDNGHKRFQIVISPNDLVVRFVHRNDGSLVDYMPKDADQGDWQLTSRGGYIHLGQYVRFPNDNQTPADYQAVTFHDLTITNATAAQDGSDGGWMARVKNFFTE